MSGFDDRRGAFESKYVHDQDRAFRIEARCCRMVGLWAAEKMGLTGDAAESYAKEVVASNLDEPGFGDVKRKLTADFKKKEISVSEHMIDRQLEIFLEAARTQLLADKQKE